jgi:hypothetical protein
LPTTLPSSSYLSPAGPAPKIENLAPLPANPYPAPVAPLGKPGTPPKPSPIK